MGYRRSKRVKRKGMAFKKEAECKEQNQENTTLIE